MAFQSMYLLITKTKSKCAFNGVAVSLGRIWLIRMPKRLVERQMAIATKIPMINNMILLVNISLTSIRIDTKGIAEVVRHERKKTGR